MRTQRRLTTWEQAFEVLENEAAEAVRVCPDTGEASIFFRGQWMPFEDYALEWETLELETDPDRSGLHWWNPQTLRWELLK